MIIFGILSFENLKTQLYVHFSTFSNIDFRIISLLKPHSDVLQRSDWPTSSSQKSSTDGRQALMTAELFHYLLKSVALRISRKAFFCLSHSCVSPLTIYSAAVIPLHTSGSSEPTINNSLFETDTLNTNSLLLPSTIIKPDCSTWGHSHYWWQYGGNMSGILNSYFGLHIPRSARNVLEYIDFKNTVHVCELSDKPLITELNPSVWRVKRITAA